MAGCPGPTGTQIGQSTGGPDKAWQEGREWGGGGRGSSGRVLQAEVARREVEALHSELALARMRARAGGERLERGKNPSSGSWSGSGLLNLCCWPLGLGPLGSGNDCGQG